MTKWFSTTAAALALVLAAAAAGAAELPTFEKRGFPITSHQVQVVGPADVLESSLGVTLNGAPASPHQLRVMRPRR